jgi:hypothetical protein
MLSSTQLIAKYGNPVSDTATFEANWMIMWNMPDDIHVLIPHLPKVIYLNKDIVVKTEAVLRALIAAGVHTEIKTYDGCFVIRDQRGSTSISSHAFGISFDLNAAWNPFKIRTTETDAQWAVVRSQIVKWSPQFLQVWRDAGWFCGADWNHRIDGMHMECF